MDNSLKIGSDSSVKGIMFICFLALASLSISSSLQTAACGYGMGNGDFWGCVYAGIGLSMDSGKIIFPTLSVFYYKKGNMAACVVFMLATIVCMTVSFYASCVMDANKMNEIDNETSGAASQRQEELFAATSKDKESTQKKIDNFNKTKDEIDKKRAHTKLMLRYEKSIKKAYAIGHITNPTSGAQMLEAKQEKALNRYNTGREARLNSLKKELKTTSTSLSSINEGFKNIKGDKKTTKGTMAFATMMTPENPEETVKKISLGKNVLIELFIPIFTLAFMVLGGSLVLKSDTNLSRWLKKKLEKEIVTEKKENRITPKQQPRKKDTSPTLFIDNEAVSEFVKLALASHSLKDNSISGLGTLAKQSNEYTRTELSKAKGMLETKHILEVRGRTTYVLDLEGLKRYV